ncbi:MAG: ABC transporter permease [Bacteroidota bacterium]
MIKVFRAFVQKEWYHIIRDKRTLLILFGMPVAQVLLFGYAISTEFKGAQVDILDYANDDSSTQLIHHLQSSGHFTLNTILASEQEMEKGFKEGTTKLVVVIPEDFDNDLYKGQEITIQLITDGSDPNNANTLLQYATTMLDDFRLEKLQRESALFQIQVEQRMLYNPQLASAYTFIPGTIALILLIVCAMLTSLTIAREKELGTMEILLVSPLPPLLIILGKVTPYAVLAFLDAVLILLLGYFIFKVPVLGSVLLLLFCCLLYVLVGLSLGTLISTRSSSQQQAMMSSLMGLMMPSLILSGFLFPLSSMPKILQFIGQIIPATYFIEILKGIMLRGVGLQFIYSEVLVLLGMVMILLAFTWKNFNVRLQ